MKNVIANNRIQWIDVVKCIAMLGVMIGHFEFFPNYIEKYWSPCLLTAFVFASGYTFHITCSYREFIRKKVRTILFPWFWMSFLTIILRFFISFKGNVDIQKQIYENLLQIRGVGDECWFLSFIFIVDVIFYLIVNRLKTRNKIVLVALIMLMLNIKYTQIVGIRLPWHFDMIGTGVYFMSIGYICNNYDYPLKNKLILISTKIIYSIACLIIYISFMYTLYHFFGSKPVGLDTYGNSILVYIILTLFSIFTLVSIAKSFTYPKWVNDIGENTLMFYGLHGKIQSFIQKAISFIPINHTDFLDVVLGIAGLVIIYVIIKPVYIFINMYCPFLIGKKSKKGVQL